MDWKILVGVLVVILGFSVYRSCSNDHPADFDEAQAQQTAARREKFEADRKSRALQQREKKVAAARQDRGSRPPRQSARLENSEFVATFTTLGGALERFELKNPQYLEHERDWSTGLLNKKSPLRPINLVTTNPADDYWTAFPLRLHFYEGLDGLLPDGDFELVDATEKWILFRYDQPDQPVVIYKKYELVPDTHPFQFWLTIRIINRSSAPVSFRPGVIQTGFQPEEEAASGIFTPQPNLQTAGCRASDNLYLEPWEEIEEPFFSTGVSFAAVGNQYFLSAMLPGDSRPVSCRVTAETSRVLRADLQWGEIDLKPGEDVVLKVKNYMGPKKYNLLASVGGHLEQAVDYGMLEPICRFLLWMLFYLQGFVGNWGIAIILLTLIIKLALVPLTNKSFKSSNQMKALKPEMDELNIKYKNDPQEKQKAIMALYKQKGVNPLGGCLPMLLQMPIWFALFSMLRGSPELYRAPFFGWITDLSAADPYFVTPLVMGALMFVQQKMMPMGGDNMQAKMMLYIMPVMFTVMMIFLPSGLTLYILVNTVLSIAHQWILKKMDERPVAVPVRHHSGKR